MKINKHFSLWRYVSGPGSGYLPGAELKIPLPMSGDVLGWSVKVTWDIQTVENNVLVTSNTKAINISCTLGVARMVCLSHGCSFRRRSILTLQDINLVPRTNFCLSQWLSGKMVRKLLQGSHVRIPKM